MDETSTQACLTVLGGSLSGTRFVIEETVDNVLIGSDPSCRFCLPVPGVSPIHARLWIDVTGATVYDTNSPRGLYVNDDRVNGQLPLRNGDILWLGTPGEEEVVMIQCRLPARAGQAVSSDEDRTARIDLAGSEQATMVLDARSTPRSAPPEPEPVPTVEASAVPEFVEVEREPLMPLDAETPPPMADTWIAPDAVEEPVRFTTEATPVPAAPPAHFEEDIEEPGSRPPSAVRVPAEPPEAFVPSFGTEPPPLVSKPVEPPPPSSPAPPASARERAPAPTPVPAARRPRAPASRPAAERTPVPPAPGRSAPPRRAGGGARNAILGGVGLLLVVAVAGIVWKLRPRPAPQVAAVVPPSTMTPPSLPPASLAPTPAPPVETAPVPAASVAPVPATPAPAPPVVEEVTIVKSPAPGTSPAPAASGRPKPSATPAAPATLPAEAVRAQEVAGLLAQADQALAANRSETAVALYDDVLKREPGNAAATAGKARAQAALVLARRTFVPGRTTVQTEKAAGKSLSGFDTEDVSLQKAPDFLGKIEFEVNPPRMASGVTYNVKVYVVNEGRKPIKIRSLTFGTSVNGSRSEQPGQPGKDIAPQQRVLVGEVGGEWREGTGSWSLDAVVTANKGDSLKNVLTWK